MTHLPISASLIYKPQVCEEEQNGQKIPRIDLDQAKRSGLIDDYWCEVHSKIPPLVDNTYDSIDQIEAEVEHVAHILTDSAARTLPKVINREKSRFQNDIVCECRMRRRVDKD